MERIEEIQTIIYLGLDDMFGKDYPYLKAGDFQDIANKIHEGELQPVNPSCATCGYPLTLQGNGIAERICTCNKQPANKTDVDFVSKDEMFEFLRWALLLDVYYRDGVGFGMGEFKQWLQDADVYEKFKNREK